VLRDIRVDDRRFDAKAILHRISRAKNAFVAADEYRADPLDEYDQVTALVYPRYQKALRAFAAVDFDDLIVETVRLGWASPFEWLLVDEYQDTNTAQLLLLKKLARTPNVTVVGDDDQSIYAFRGAEASNILEFDRHFPGATVVKLEQNYRSTPTILAAANAVIRHNAARHAKALWSDRGSGERIALYACGDAEAEAKLVCDEIERLRHEERRRARDIAVLYRSNVQARLLEEALRSRRIPHEVHGGQKFYERKEVKDVLAYLAASLHPRDEIALRRVINYPSRGIGAATVERAAGHGTSLWEGLRSFDEAQGGTAAARQAVAGFVGLMERTREGIAREGGLAVRTLVEEIRLYDDLRAAAASLPAAQRRVDHVEDLLRSLEPCRGPEELRARLDALSLRTSDEDDADSGDQVTLSTLHGAKGLEWPIVFLVGMEEELLPHARSLAPAEIAEERRLAYVGITRARERLILSWARLRHRHGGERETEPSRFLAEIPAEVLEKHDLMAAPRQVQADEMAGFFRKLAGSSP
jgi:DNA helicase II / ATP-dependent DNA helicase PcrA